MSDYVGSSPNPLISSLNLSDSEEDDDGVVVNHHHHHHAGQALSPEDTIEEKRSLLTQYLTLENPVMTNKISTFLNDEAVIPLFIEFITRIPCKTRADARYGPLAVDAVTVTEPVVRESREPTETLKLSYQVTSLLLNESPQEGWATYLKQNASVLTSLLFRVFQANSTGSLVHACSVLDRIAKCSLVEVYKVMSEDVPRYFENMLQYLEEPCVADLFITLICKPHNTKVVQYYISSPASKWDLFMKLADWRILVRLSQRLSGTSAIAPTTDGEEQKTLFSTSEASAAADVFMELIDRLVANDNGEVLLSPLAYCPELLQDLISAAFNNDIKDDVKRTAAMRCILHLLELSAKKEVEGPPTSPYEQFGAMSANMVPNQLKNLGGKIFESVEERMPVLLKYLESQYVKQQNIELPIDVVNGENRDAPLPQCSVRHTSYVVKVPFSEFRMNLVYALVEMVKRNPSLLLQFKIEVWRALVRWFFEYGHNNLYHAAFYQLFFITLQQNDESVLRLLIQKLKLITKMIEIFQGDSRPSSIRGYIIKMCNAIRLQNSTLPPESYLRAYCNSHEKWSSFVPNLRDLTLASRKKGLGIDVPQRLRLGADTIYDATADFEGIDLGSEYAKSLGFDTQEPYVEDEEESTTTTNSTSSSKKKKKSAAKKSLESDDSWMDDASAVAATSPPPPPPSSSGSKKKKKKKSQG